MSLCYRWHCVNELQLTKNKTNLLKISQETTNTEQVIGCSGRTTCNWCNVRHSFFVHRQFLLCHPSIALGGTFFCLKSLSYGEIDHSERTAGLWVCFVFFLVWIEFAPFVQKYVRFCKIRLCRYKIGCIRKKRRACVYDMIAAANVGYFCRCYLLCICSVSWELVRNWVNLDTLRFFYASLANRITIASHLHNEPPDKKTRAAVVRR